MSTSGLRHLVAPLRADPGGSVLLFDFDGTLSTIVDHPDDARPLDGVVDLLDELARSYRVVGAVSGRPLDFLAAQLPASLLLSGLYGLEWRVDGERHEREGVERWRSVVGEASARAEAAGIDGLLVEPKGLSVTLHFRTHPRAAAPTTRLASELGAELGLEVRPAKMSLELHPPVATDKGRAVREAADGARSLLYAGDDVGDLPAFAALAELRGQGVATVAVGVETPELPDAVREVADVLVPGPAGVVELLGALRP